MLWSLNNIQGGKVIYATKCSCRYSETLLNSWCSSSSPNIRSDKRSKHTAHGFFFIFLFWKFSNMPSNGDMWPNCRIFVNTVFYKILLLTLSKHISGSSKVINVLPCPKYLNAQRLQQPLLIISLYNFISSSEAILSRAKYKNFSEKVRLRRKKIEYIGLFLTFSNE